MPLIIGIFIIPLIILIINKSNLVTTKKKHQIMLNILLILICIIYIVFCFEINLEPFKFEEQYSKEYMIYTGRYIFWNYFCIYTIYVDCISTLFENAV